jgi:hypothetical protein
MQPRRSTPDQVQDLIEAVTTLAWEVRLLREVLDELREEVSWAVKNLDPNDSWLPARTYEPAS